MEPEATMRGLLDLLERQREDLVGILRGLQREHDAERAFSHDRFDLDYDADLAACVATGAPLLTAMADAVASVTAILGRTRGGGA